MFIVSINPKDRGFSVSFVTIYLVFRARGACFLVSLLFLTVPVLDRVGSVFYWAALSLKVGAAPFHRWLSLFFTYMDFERLLLFMGGLKIIPIYYMRFLRGQIKRALVVGCLVFVLFYCVTTKGLLGPLLALNLFSLRSSLLIVRVSFFVFLVYMAFFVLGLKLFFMSLVEVEGKDKRRFMGQGPSIVVLVVVFLVSLPLSPLFIIKVFIVSIVRNMLRVGVMVLYLFRSISTVYCMMQFLYSSPLFFFHLKRLLVVK